MELTKVKKCQDEAKAGKNCNERVHLAVFTFAEVNILTLDTAALYVLIPTGLVIRRNQRILAFSRAVESDFLECILSKKTSIDVNCELYVLWFCVGPVPQRLTLDLKFDRSCVSQPIERSKSALAECASLHGCSKSSASRALRRVTKALVQIRNDEIKFPITPASVTNAQREFFLVAGFPQVVGAVDGTLIGIHGCNYGPDDAQTRTRAKIEQVNGQLKNKFRCLLGDGMQIEPQRACDIIVACCILFNISKDLKEPHLDPSVTNRFNQTQMKLVQHLIMSMGQLSGQI
ncbi:putative nuclease HARBI1 isoform X2 [Apostichopus japonicus]|uniref:Putative nuclease HARBI1 isoform X2 n=1 Tax=Stichopus japonicus TaxID=307972 RepID=A0A2G8KYJ0_STIJA|nr:putative nuclease HARBI1 isoform X2 [Apostichopus japonicus]